MGKKKKYYRLLAWLMTLVTVLSLSAPAAARAEVIEDFTPRRIMIKRDTEYEGEDYGISFFGNYDAAEETEITYYMPYLYDIDLVNIYDYTFTYSLAVGDAAVITDQAPILAEGDELDKVSDKGDFQNNADGVGGGKPKKPVNKTLVVTISVVAIIVAAIAALVVAKIMMDKKNKTA